MSIQHTRRWPTREVLVGHVGIGGNNPIRVQSMTTTPTLDVDATTRQALALADAGCEIVRITAQNVEAAKALESISKKIRTAGCKVPLVADIHFLPAAAMEAVKHVEKVRVNPGNYADKKKFAVLEYSDADYERELQRLYEAVSPLILECKSRGRVLRVGTNHGSLSDRIMNRYGDTPLGMVESALEFIRIAQSHSFHDIVVSLKASNPKIMVEAYRLAAFKMAQLGMDYPLHLGVTEAGDGEDGRIKSAIGIGTLLAEGIGDTIRVSLTEDPVYEIPVAKTLAARAHKLWTAPRTSPRSAPTPYNRAESLPLSWPSCVIGGDQPPRVIVRAPNELDDLPAIIKSITTAHARSADQRVEGLLFKISSPSQLPALRELAALLKDALPAFIIEPAGHLCAEDFEDFALEAPHLCLAIHPENAHLTAWIQLSRQRDWTLAVGTSAAELGALLPQLAHHPRLALWPIREASKTWIDSARALAAALDQRALKIPLWLRMGKLTEIMPCIGFSDILIETSIQAGALLIAGVGDLISTERPAHFDQALALAYNTLQGARVRQTKTEFVACPSCGRTLFDLQTTTQKVREATGHLKGVTIAIMGCIVNGPGEMADADFGYVGGAPGKINLYVKKECVRYNIPEHEAVQTLIALIKEKGKWLDA